VACGREVVMNKLGKYFMVAAGCVIFTACMVFAPSGRGEAASGTCQYSTSPLGASYPGNGGCASFDVITGNECSWIVSASPDATWIYNIVQPSDFTDYAAVGPDTVTYYVAPNLTTVPRQGTINVIAFEDGSIQASFTISQDGCPDDCPRDPCLTPGAVCSYTVTPDSRSHGPGVETGVINVIAADSCSWVATTPQSWITITAQSTAMGNGMATYSVAPNTDTTSRTGFVHIGGLFFTVIQAGKAPCSFSIASGSAEVSAAQGSGDVLVAAPNGCAWSASSNAAWITITSAVNGTGSGNVTYLVAPNDGCRRNGTLSIAGQTFTVTQDALAGNCPIISGIAIEHKNLLVTGQDFDNGAVILLNEQPQPTLQDSQNPTTTLIGEKLRKKIEPGQTVEVQVRNSNGALSPAFTFTRPIGQ